MSTEGARRADARENRRRLIDAAREAFAGGGGRVPLEVIAARAGVGIGTLYRHFPKREALVEAVYRNQIDELNAGADALLASHPPVEALRLWMDLFAEWAAAKRGMVDTLAAMRSSGALDFAASRREIEGILEKLLAAGREAGQLRADIDPADLRSLLAGAMAVAEDGAQAGRLFGLILDAVKLAGERESGLNTRELAPQGFSGRGETCTAFSPLARSPEEERSGRRRSRRP